MRVFVFAGLVGILSTGLLACDGVIPGNGGASTSSGSGATNGSGAANGAGAATGAGAANGVGAATGAGAATGSGGVTGTDAGTGTGGAGAAYGSGGVGTGPIVPWGAASQFSALRKVKNALTGLAPTDAEVTAATDSAALRTLIDTWQGTPEFQDKMLLFFANGYQQSSLAILDFEFQLRKRPGAFDLSYAIFGDSAFPMLFQNMKESFARTALAFVAAGRPMTDLLTTQQFMLTTALKSLYLQIEMPYDIHTMNFTFNQGTRPPLAQSAGTLAFGYAPPTTSSGRVFGGTCAGDATKVSTFAGNTLLFQVLLGSIPRDTSANVGAVSQLGCMEHASQPYFTSQDLSDWQLVTISNTGTPLRSWDLPALRASGTTLVTKLPRVSFFTTPAFLAVWNTNDSNQHRVTANQALLGALGQGFTSADQNIPAPPSTTGLDGEHAVDGSICLLCHRSLDPMRQFWANNFDFNDQAIATPRTTGGSFGFGDVQQNGASLVDFGKFLSQVSDSQVAGSTVNRFALALTQKLCFFGNSTRCAETDPEMRRIALAFQTANYDFKVLVRELFSSPLVTNAANTATFDSDGVVVSVARRDQLCTALSNRLGQADLCEIQMPTPTDVTSATNRLAGAISADAFSRGSAEPVTPADPNLFYRAASELVCEAVAKKVVDGTTNNVYSSTNAQAAIADMVSKIMGYSSSDPSYAAALKALQDHYAAATTTARATPTNALRSTFAAACQSPTSLSLGI